MHTYIIQFVKAGKKVKYNDWGIPICTEMEHVGNNCLVKNAVVTEVNKEIPDMYENI